MSYWDNYEGIINFALLISHMNILFVLLITRMYSIIFISSILFSGIYLGELILYN